MPAIEQLELHLLYLPLLSLQLLPLVCCLVSPLSMLTLAHSADQYGPVDNELMGIFSMTTVALVEHRIAFYLC